jgi:hypothetical protein
MEDQAKWLELKKPFAKIIKHSNSQSGTISDGKDQFDKEIIWDLAPFIIGLCIVLDVGAESSGVGQGP